MYVILRFLHIASAIAFVGGVFSRQLARSVALRCDRPQDIALGFRVADPIERFMVIPGSILATIFGVLLALVAGVPMFGFLQGASSNWLLAANVLILSSGHCPKLGTVFSGMLIGIPKLDDLLLQQLRADRVSEDKPRHPVPVCSSPTRQIFVICVTMLTINVFPVN